MGTDTPLAGLSDRAPGLPAYYHQLIAQGTNPPVDPQRESLGMALDASLVPDGNTFDETPEQCHQLRLRGPILDNHELAKIATIREGAFEPATLSTLFDAAYGAVGLAAAVERLCRAAVQA